MGRFQHRLSGFTLIELMIVAAIAGLLIVIAVPAFNSYRDHSRHAQAIADIGSISLNIDRFRLSNGDTLPPDLGVLGRGQMLDPWGNPYRYVIVGGADPGVVRTDRHELPLNTDFDLYSRGPDGVSSSELTEHESRDDIVRANNGSFIGSVAEY